MTEQQPTPAADDVEGHGRWGPGADGERDETDDTEGHGRWGPGADGERDETDDTEGHGRWHPGADALAARGLRPTDPRADEEDDVVGHLSGALGSKKKTDDA